MMGRKNLLLVCVVMMLTGCSGDGAIYPFWAKPATLNPNEAPAGPPNYQQGYRDGCKTALSSWSLPHNKLWWKFKQEPELRSDPVYYQMWKDAYAYCAAFINSIEPHGIGNYDRQGVFEQ